MANRASIRVRKKEAKKVLTIPCWALLAVVMRGRLVVIMALGPDFSSHVWSTIWVAMNCPSTRLILGGKRWTSAGKKPSMLEKLWGAMWGVGLNCLLVNCASSRAVKRPRSVTARAASFRRVGIVMTAVLGNTILEVIRRPAMMLPQASRLMGFKTAGWFSLMGDNELNRGCPMETK